MNDAPRMQLTCGTYTLDDVNMSFFTTTGLNFSALDGVDRKSIAMH